MSDTPDLSKIVSTIMENPALIEQISSLMKQKSDSAPLEVSDSTIESTEAITVSTESEASLFRSEGIKGGSRASRRHELIRAMKPYLSETRCKTVDTAIAIADIVDMIRR